MKKTGTEVIIDFLNIKNMKIIQRNDHLNFSIDSVLVSNFLTINRKTKTIMDLGTGNGVIPMLLSRRTSANITGIEIQEISVNLAKRNMTLNNINEQVQIIHGDINDISNNFEQQSYDAVITNPPFFKLDGNQNQLNDLDQLTLARHEVSIDLEGIVKAGAYLLKNRGYFTIVHRADRLLEILNNLTKYNLNPKRLQFCHSSFDKPSKIVLIEAMKNSDVNLTIMPPLFTHKENGEYSDRIIAMYE